MANELNEMTAQPNSAGRDLFVIEKQIPVKVTKWSAVFQFFLWFPFIIPGLIFVFKKQKAKERLATLEQNLQVKASTVDNYLEQRVVVLKNVVGLVEKATKLDKDTFTAIAALRSGVRPTAPEGNEDATRNILSNQIDNGFREINVAFEKYPELKSIAVIADAMQQNISLQREITAARDLYNDAVHQWNKEIQEWPAKRIVAAKAGYTTRVPFSASQEIKDQARETFF